MKRLSVVVGASAALWAVGCGSSSNTGTPGSCTVILSGAITATASCQIAAATTANTGGKVSFGFEGLAGTATVTSSTVLDQTTLTTGTYGSSSGTSVTSSAASVTTTAGPSWLQFFNETDVPDLGSFTLTISSTGSSVPSGSDVGWPDPGGSLTITLTPVVGTGATGNVTASATF